MKIEEKDLAGRIEGALFDEFFNETGVITINVENGYIKQILLDLEYEKDNVQ